MARAKRKVAKSAGGRPAARPKVVRKSRPGYVEPYAGEDLVRARIQVTTIGDLLLTAADRHPESLALVLPGRTLTYAQLARRALRRARSLHAMGVQPGDHVGILMHTCVEFVELFFAVAFCGAVIVPINARYKASELAYVIQNGDLVTILTTDAVAESVDFVERLSAALPVKKNRPAQSRNAVISPSPRATLRESEARLPACSAASLPNSGGQTPTTSSPRESSR